jgi:DHA3 family macrolide efflux protein-like MFS transporter
MAFVGIVMPLYNVPSTTLFQEKIDPSYLGRVFAVYGMLSTLLMPLGMLIFGPLSDRVSIDILLICTGAAVALTGIPYITDKVIRSAG